MNRMLNLALVVFLFFLTSILGFVLHRSGKPYGPVLFTVHKLTGFACVVLLILLLIPLVKGCGVGGPVVAMVILGALCVIALLATGGIMSAKEGLMPALPLIHGIATGLFLIDVGGLLILLFR